MSECDNCPGTEAHHHLCNGCVEKDIWRESAVMTERDALKQRIAVAERRAIVAEATAAYWKARLDLRAAITAGDVEKRQTRRARLAVVESALVDLGVKVPS